MKQFCHLEDIWNYDQYVGGDIKQFMRSLGVPHSLADTFEVNPSDGEGQFSLTMHYTFSGPRTISLGDWVGYNHHSRTIRTQWWPPGNNQAEVVVIPKKPTEGERNGKD